MNIWAAWMLCTGLASAETLTVWHATRDAERAGLEEAFEAWSETSGHEVRTVALPFGAFASKIETAIPRDNGPDLFIGAHDALGKWTDMGLLAPVTTDGSGYRKVTVDALTLNGQRWGEPLATKSLVLFYDPTRIDTPPATTDAMLALAKTHTGDGRYGLGLQAAEAYFHAPWMHAFGASALTDGAVTLDTPEQVQALAFTRHVAIDSGTVPPQPTGELIGRLYGEGQLAMVVSGPWFLGQSDHPIAAAPLPTVSETGMPAAPYLTVDAAFVSRTAAHPAPAHDLAAWLAGPEGSAIRYAKGRQAVAWTDQAIDDPMIQVLTEQAKTSVPFPTDPTLATAFEAQARALRDVLRGARTPEEAARDAQGYADVLTRPAPPAVSPTPYLIGLGLLLLAGLGALGLQLRNPELRQRLYQHRWDYTWIGPAAFALLMLVVLPFITGAGVSLLAHDRGSWTFVGLAHFSDILLARDWPVTSPLSFFFTLVVTVFWTVSNLALHVGLGVALALVLREPWIRLRGVWRALLILPWAIPNYITALIWKAMFHAQFGAVNALLGLVVGHQVQIDWFGSFALAFSANLATNTWLGFPFMMVITLGALQSVPRELEEAAEVDGASWLMRFRHVVWPLLAPALLPAIILGSVWTFNMFNVVYLVSGGEPGGATEILISEAYRWAFSRGNRYGYAAAYAVMIFGVLLVYSRAANRMAGQRIL